MSSEFLPFNSFEIRFLAFNEIIKDVIDDASDMSMRSANIRLYG